MLTDNRIAKSPLLHTRRAISKLLSTCAVAVPWPRRCVNSAFPGLSIVSVLGVHGRDAGTNGCVDKTCCQLADISIETVRQTGRHGAKQDMLNAVSKAAAD